MKKIAEMPKKQKQKILITMFIGLLLIFILYVFNTKFDLSGNGGTLNITGTTDDMIVYLDKNIATVIKKTGNIYTKKVSVGEHLIVAHKEGYWPWAETINISKDDTVYLEPYLFSQKPVAETVATGDPEYERLKTSFPKEREKLITYWDGTATASMSPALIYTENDGDCVEGCKTLVPLGKIQNVDFFPGRNDTLLVAMDDRILAIDASPEGIQNVQPIYVGTDGINFFVDFDETIYILDQNEILKLLK